MSQGAPATRWAASKALMWPFGMDGLTVLNYHEPKSALDDLSAKVEASFREH